MRKLIMMLVVLGMLVAFPAAAGAKKPPPGQEPKLEGQTCAAYGFDDTWQTSQVDSDFDVLLDSLHPYACYDVTSVEGPWSITIVAPPVGRLEMQIKDSVPGDFCFRHGWGKRNDPIPADPFSVGMPEAGENACTPGEVGLASDDNAALVFLVAYTPERNTTAFAVTITVDLPES